MRVQAGQQHLWDGVYLEGQRGEGVHGTAGQLPQGAAEGMRSRVLAPEYWDILRWSASCTHAEACHSLDMTAPSLHRLVLHTQAHADELLLRES